MALKMALKSYSLQAVTRQRYRRDFFSVQLFDAKKKKHWGFCLWTLKKKKGNQHRGYAQLCEQKRSPLTLGMFPEFTFPTWRLHALRPTADTRRCLQTNLWVDIYFWHNNMVRDWKRLGFKIKERRRQESKPYRVWSLSLSQEKWG